MKTVHRYPIAMDDRWLLSLPRGAEILHVGRQNYKPYLWALVDPEGPLETYRFSTRRTEEPVDPFLHHYLGSFLANDDKDIWHVFADKPLKSTT